MAVLVLTVYGDDRSGLVDALSEVIADNGGSWDKSYMAELAGKFAGVVQVTAPATKIGSLTAELDTLRSRGLEITVHEAEPVAQPAAHRELSLELVGQDHPGIVHDISHALAQSGVSIAELSTEVRDAPMAGGTLFVARALLHAPNELPVGELQAALEELANNLMVDIELHVEADG